MGIFNLFKKSRKLEDSEDFEKDISTMMETLYVSTKDIKEIYDLLINIKKIRSKERSQLDDKKQLKLLEEEILSWDKFLEMFVAFKRDVDLNGQRAKKISQVLREEADDGIVQSIVIQERCWSEYNLFFHH